MPQGLWDICDIRKSRLKNDYIFKNLLYLVSNLSGRP